MAATNHFLQNIADNNEGRYEIKMPWIEGNPTLPNYIELTETFNSVSLETQKIEDNRRSSRRSD